MIQLLTSNKKNLLPIMYIFYLTMLICMFVPMIHVNAQRNEARVAGNWTFDDGSAKDSSNKGLNGTFLDEPASVKGIVGKALEFDGENDAVNIPDSVDINSGGPYQNRTIAAFFKCSDTNKNGKQMIYQEGGGTRGLCMYVYRGRVYVGGWNQAEYNWEGSWPSEKIKSNRWYHVGLVIRDGNSKVENGKFEMWLDGKLTAKEEGGQLHSHANNISIGYVTQKTVYHDGLADGTNIDWYEGLIDEVIVYNSAFTSGDFTKIARPLSIEVQDKYTITWGYLKSEQTKY